MNTIVWIVALLLVSSATSSAQGERLKPGDRVQDGRTGDYGTILEVDPDPYSNCYRVLFDYQKSTGSRGTNVCSYGQAGAIFLVDAEGRRVRDAGVAGATVPAPKRDSTSPPIPPGPVPPVPPAPDGTVAPSPAHCQGEPLVTIQRTGPPSEALFRNILKHDADRPAARGQDKRILTITRFTMGAPYQWRPLTDFQFGTREKTIHPVYVRYITCTTGQIFYGFTETVTDEEYSCYIHEQRGDWTCDIRKAADLKTSSIPKQ